MGQLIVRDEMQRGTAPLVAKLHHVRLLDVVCFKEDFLTSACMAGQVIALLSLCVELRSAMQAHPAAWRLCHLLHLFLCCTQSHTGRQLIPKHISAACFHLQFTSVLTVSETIACIPGAAQRPSHCAADLSHSQPVLTTCIWPHACFASILCRHS